MNPSILSAAVHTHILAGRMVCCDLYPRSQGNVHGQGGDEVNHTPAPWLRDGLTIYALHHNGDYYKGKPRMVNRFSAHIEPCLYQGGSTDEAEANARLIQAAPDMYEALQAMLNAHTQRDGSIARSKAIDALAKAEGK